MSKDKLNTTNPEALKYANPLIEITVLGGIRIEGLDRMRATLKVKLKDSLRPPLRHNLDLYNDLQVEKFIRKCAEKLEVGTSVIEASLAELTEQLENYRFEESKKLEVKDIHEIPPLSHKEREEAINFLKQPNLLERTNELIGQSGVIGEEVNRLLMYLIFTSRLRSQPLHCVSLGSSGSGKTHLQSKVGELIPEEEKLEITTLSENAFYYFGQRELKNKLILIEDLDGAESVLYPIRELQTKNKIIKTVVQKDRRGLTKTIYLKVEGPVSVAGCTTRERIYEDNANRSFLLYLDESPAQDEKIMEYQRAASSGKIDKHKEKQAAELLRKVQRVLSPVQVYNPYAEHLKIPNEVFKPRRTNAHYLAFIEIITFYHQWQRPQRVNKDTGEVYIETTLEDIAEANQLMKEVLLRKSDELSGACRDYFEKLKIWLVKNRKKTWMNYEVRKVFRLPDTTHKRYTRQLLTNGYIRIKSGKKHTGYLYEVTSYKEYEKLQEQVTTVLDDILESLRKCHPDMGQSGSPRVGHSANGLPKPKKTSQLQRQSGQSGKDQPQEKILTDH